MKKELRVFFTALMFYSRIPCPNWVGHSRELLEKSIRYFPFIGYIVGGISVITLYISNLILPVSISIILSMLAGILTTGAFHEDGLADVCDGFGGGWNRSKILEIMKDSRIGTYGVVGLVLVLSSKFVLSIELSMISVNYLMMIMFAGHSLSRLSATTMILMYDYARDDNTSKTKPSINKLSIGNYIIALLIGLLPLIIVAWLWSLYAYFLIIPLLFLTIYLGQYFKKWIGGFTGDCLGSVQQLSEILIYIYFLALWRFI